MTRWLAFLLLVVLGASPVAARADWTRVIAATPEGGYLIGNPNAPVRVIEYFSLTCTHCRQFVETGLPPFKANYVATGKVRLELRNFVLNQHDFVASLLMKCGSPAAAVRYYSAVYADHDRFLAGALDMAPDAIARIEAAPPERRIPVLAREAGIARWFVAHGFPQARVDFCLTDKGGQDRLVALRRMGIERDSIQGTPGFVVNGKTVDGATWDQLEPALRAALGTSR